MLLLAGCPRTRRPIVPEAPATGDAVARTRFSEASLQYRAGADSAAEFSAIAADFPDDPIAPWAHLYAGMAHVRNKAYAAAERELSAVPPTSEPALAGKARLYLGIAKHYQRDHVAAATLLLNAEAFVETETERGEWLACVAMSLSHAEPRVAVTSLPYFDRWWPLATEPERGAILSRVIEVANAAPADAIDEAWPSSRGVARWALASRRAMETGTDRAAMVLRQRELADAAAAIGLAAPATVSSSPRIGALVAQSGKHAKVGDIVLTGLGVVVDALGGANNPSGGDGAIDVRDASTPEAAEAAVAELASQGVRALVGPTDGASADRAAARAATSQVLLISLATRPEERAPQATTFHIVHSAEARTRALARRAVKAGAARILTVGPDSGYGRAMIAQFRAAAGTAAAASKLYPADSKSFATFAAELGTDWDAIFVADSSDRLALLAPALAAAGHVSQVDPKAPRKRGRGILLLATADGLNEAFFRAAGRHAEGAIFAPGYYADAQTLGAAQDFTTYAGRAPGALDAFAYDAAQAALAWTQTGLAPAAFASTRFVGLTGRLDFDDKHCRSDEPLIYVGAVTTAKPLP